MDPSVVAKPDAAQRGVEGLVDAGGSRSLLGVAVDQRDQSVEEPQRRADLRSANVPESNAGAVSEPVAVPIP